MSLTIALNTALSALQYTQGAIQVTSNNVANANTPGFTRKTVTPLTQVVDGMGAGVLSSSVGRTVDQSLIQELREQNSELGRLRVRQEFFERMQDMFGSLSSDSSLSDTISNLAGAFESLVAAPEDSTRRLQVVNAAINVANQFNSTAEEIQDLRQEADQKIFEATRELNSLFSRVFELNEEIAKATALNDSTANLKDQRDEAINSISQLIDIRTFERDSGEIVVFTAGGRPLVDNSAATITHTPAAGVDASIVYPGGFDAIALNGADITNEIQSGRLAALIDLRDQRLPELATEINTLALALRDEINAIHNDGTGFPAPNGLTGTLPVAGADPFAGTGTVRIAVVDGSGNVVDNVDLDLGALGATDVTTVMGSINAALAGNATASIVNGRLAITADAGTNGIVIDEGDSNVTATSRGFSHHFGLNDFFVGDATANFSRNISVNATIAADPQKLSRGQLAAAPLVVGSPGITSGDNSVVQRLAGVFEQATSFSAAGQLPALSTKFSDYAAQIVAQNASGADSVKQTLRFREALHADLEFRAQSASGVNVDEEMADLIVLQNSFTAASRVINVTAELMEVLIALGQ